MESLALPRIGLEAGTGALVGALVGFAAKKMAKLAALVMGLQLALVKVLESRGLIAVDWTELQDAVDAGTDAVVGTGAGGAGTPEWVATLLSTLSVSAGFTGGFLLGFRRG